MDVPELDRSQKTPANIGVSPHAQSNSKQDSGHSPAVTPPAKSSQTVAHIITPEQSLQLLLAVVESYLTPLDVANIKRAFVLAEAAHSGQFRKSGEAYVTHPIAVATILAQWRMDSETLMAAIMHDVVEDTDTTLQELAQQFGAPVANLVDGVSKMDKLKFESAEAAQAENFRKMIIAMASDLRVILIKLADRLHNMRTMGSVGEAKQKRVSQETLETYTPIARRLGLNNVFNELSELCFRYIHPEEYRELSAAVAGTRTAYEVTVEAVAEMIQKKLAEFGVVAEVVGRKKLLSSIYEKMLKKERKFADVNDLYAFRIVVPDYTACYVALGALHALYRPVPGMVKDYVATPKVNGYQSLHTVVSTPLAARTEVQIRTAEMHKVAEAGVAAHWLYKSDDSGEQKKISEAHRKALQWLQELLDSDKKAANALEFFELIKASLFLNAVYAITPEGKTINFPVAATVVDFAYAIHSKVGDEAIGAKINEVEVPLSTRLHNGDVVQIITQKGSKPKPSWLSTVASAKARAHIRHYLKNKNIEESIALGELLLIQAVRAIDRDPNEMGLIHWDRALKSEGGRVKNDVLAEIGMGKILAVVIARRLFGVADTAEVVGATVKPHEIVAIRGGQDVPFVFAECCRPIPGDGIVAMMQRGRGLMVHTQDCAWLKAAHPDTSRLVNVHWGANEGKGHSHSQTKDFPVDIDVRVMNGRGVLANLTGAIAKADANIETVAVVSGGASENMLSVLRFTIEVKDRTHLSKVLKQLRALTEVRHIRRIKTGKIKEPHSDRT
jgi:GTP diphosphokinase / guanosine-3',5'-bis(diphosphate) 3'-diphosphatase